MRLIDADKFADTLKEIAESKWCKPEYTEAFYVVGNLLVGRDKEKYSPTINIEEYKTYIDKLWRLQK